MATYYVYILSSRKNTTLYIGVTNNLKRRIGEHRDCKGKSFTKRYNVNKLVYYEKYNQIIKAIQREKNLKKWNRSWKDQLINSSNPSWRDLSGEVFA